MAKYFFVVVLLIVSEVANGQLIQLDDDSELIQLSGVVHDDFGQPLHFVNIKILNRQKGTISDQNGIFSFVAQPDDTIRFSSMGYKPAIFVLPDSLPNQHLTIDVYLASDTIMIPEAIILPWKTYEEFKQAVLAYEAPNDDMKNAAKNIALIQTQILLADKPTPTENFKYVMQQQYEQNMAKGLAYPVIKLFDPLAWARFIEAVKDGDFKKKEK